MHYENGPLLGPANHKDIPDFESLATFDTEIRKNDAPKGIMKGTTAIARGHFGDGRVVCFSTHPEKSRGCGAYVEEMVRWAADADKPEFVHKIAVRQFLLCRVADTQHNDQVIMNSEQNSMLVLLRAVVQLIQLKLEAIAFACRMAPVRMTSQ